MNPASGRKSAAAGKRRRAEIEGLRTVAALLVAIYHIWVGRVSGGVDVFFVVTGYFITLMLLKAAVQGRPRAGEFFGRLYRRLLPSGAVVLIAAVLITLFAAPAALRLRNFQEIIASALSVENLFLAFTSVDYLSASDHTTPVQHFWAMSLQWQFYAVWFLVAWAAWAISRRRGSSVQRTMAWLIGGVFVVSLALSIWQTATVQPVAYFVPWTRFWEFSVGAGLALLGDRVRLRGTAAGIASWVALIVLVLTGLVLPVEAAFPGVAAFVPVVAASLVLMSTREDERPWAGTRVLSLPPLVRLGSIAFGIYLWHWPLLSLYRYLMGLDQRPGVLAGVGIIATATLLAALAKRFVEDPIRSGWSAGRRRGLVMAIPALGMVLALLVPVFAQARAIAVPSTTEATEEGCSGYGTLADPEGCASFDPESELIPARDMLKDDVSSAYSCFTRAQHKDIQHCDVIAPDDLALGSGAPRVALLGNSHAAMLLPEFERAAVERGWELTPVVSNGCVFANTPDDDAACERKLSQLRELLLEDPFDVVVVTGGFIYEDDSATGDVVPDRFRELLAAGSEVIVLEDNPRLPEEVVTCVVESSDEQLLEGACSVADTAGYAYTDNYWEAADAVPEVKTVSTRDFYCVDGECPAVIGNVIVYRDGHHLTSTYLATMGPALIDRLVDSSDALR